MTLLIVVSELSVGRDADHVRVPPPKRGVGEPFTPPRRIGGAATAAVELSEGLSVPKTAFRQVSSTHGLDVNEADPDATGPSGGEGNDEGGDSERPRGVASIAKDQ
jgi:hypothetical protein